MRYYAKIDPSGDNHKFLSPPEDSFQITELLNGLPSFEFIIQNTSGNRTILSDHLTDDFQICRVSDDLVVLTGSIDSDNIEYFSENEANPDRIRLTGFASYVDLAYLLFKRLADADAQAVDKVFDLDASGPTYTDYTAAANNDVIDDVLLTFGAVDDAHYIGQDETFSVVKTKYSTKGVYNATVVHEYWNGAAWVAVDTLDAITYIDESRGFTKDPGTYYLVLSGKPSDWAKTTVNGVEKYWIRIRISVWTSTTTAPKLDRIWIGDTDIYRVQFDNIAADTILGYVLDGTGYTEDAVDQCPADLISMRMEYESRMRCAFGVAKALTWDDGGDKKPYDCWITTADKKVHFKQQRGSAKGDISADLTMLGKIEGYQGIGNRIFGLGSFDGINQKRAIVENQSSQDSYSLREIFRKDMRFSYEVTLKELIQKVLTDSKAPLKEVSCEIETKYWLDNSLAVGDEVTIDQPDWNVSAQTYRIMQAVIDPSRTTLDLGVVQTHLENIRDVLQKQIDVSDVFMQGCTTAFSLPSFAQNIEKTAVPESFYAYMQFKIPKNCKYVNSLDLFWYLDNFRAPSKITAGGSAHSHTITGQATAAGSAHTHSITGKATSGGAAHSHGFGAAETTQAADSSYVTGFVIQTATGSTFSKAIHTHKIYTQNGAPDYPLGWKVGETCGELFAEGCVTGNHIETEVGSDSLTGWLPTTLSLAMDLTKQTHTHKLQGATTVDESTHTHPITGIATDSESAHTHTITGQATDSESAHTHAIGYGIQEEAAPANIIAVDIKIGAGGWNALPDSPYTGDKSEVDIRDVVGQNISGGEIIQIRFLPNTAGRCWIRGGGDFQGFIESK